MPHPYVEFEDSPIWQAVDRAISELERNGDVALTTARPYVVGYLCTQLGDGHVTTGAALRPSAPQANAQTDALANGVAPAISDRVTYRVNAPHDDAALNAFFQHAWPGHRPRAFGPILKRSLATVSAFSADRLVGFVNLATDGGEHAFVLDPAVAPAYRRRGIGLELIRRGADVARQHHCRWLHVDYEPHLTPFYRAAGFRDSTAAVMHLDRTA